MIDHTDLRVFYGWTELTVALSYDKLNIAAFVLDSPALQPNDLQQTCYTIVVHVLRMLAADPFDREYGGGHTLRHDELILSPRSRAIHPGVAQDACSTLKSAQAARNVPHLPQRFVSKLLRHTRRDPPFSGHQRHAFRTQRHLGAPDPG